MKQTAIDKIETAKAERAAAFLNWKTVRAERFAIIPFPLCYAPEHEALKVLDAADRKLNRLIGQNERRAREAADRK